jgi:hypothetical protein
MSSVLTERAERYLKTLERVPSITDEQRIVEILERAGAPPFEKIVEFQRRFGGYVEFYGYNKFIWGILHEIPEEFSFLEPNVPDFDAEDGEYFFTCANCHRSDSWSLDTKGILYWCGYKKALSFEKKIERDAAVREIFADRKSKRVKFELPYDEIVEIVIPKIENGLIEAASDEDQKLYFCDNFYVALDCEDECVIAALVDEKPPAWLESLPYKFGS